MSSIINGLSNIITGIFQAIVGLVNSVLNVVYSIFHAAFTVVWNLLESTGQLVGASANFVFSNILVLGLIGVGVIVYLDRQNRAKVGGGRTKVSSGKKLQ